MSVNSKIEWTEATWNPITGCTKISEGCQNCYAERMSKRLAGRWGYPKENPFAVTFHENRLDEPLKWKKPRRIFVCSMGDLFHEDVKESWIDQIMEVIDDCPQHTFLILTKRPENMWVKLHGVTEEVPCRFLGSGDFPDNVWLGVTAENSEQAWKRIPLLAEFYPAKIKFVSVEPMLGPLTIHPKWADKIDWVICGGETGPGARPIDPFWASNLKLQCQAAQIPFFFKQIGAGNKSRLLDGELYEEMPKLEGE